MPGKHCECCGVLCTVCLFDPATQVEPKPFELRPPHQTLPYVKDSATSKIAAKSMEVEASQLREAVFGFIAGFGKHGATCDEVEVMMGRSHQSVSARITELKKARRIVQRGRRKTRSGRPADIHVVDTIGGA